MLVGEPKMPERIYDGIIGAGYAVERGSVIGTVPLGRVRNGCNVRNIAAQLGNRRACCNRSRRRKEERVGERGS